MSQVNNILKHMRQGFWIDPLRALNQFDCRSLGQRISEAQGLSGHKRLLRSDESIEKGWLHLRKGKRVRKYRLARKAA